MNFEPRRHIWFSKIKVLIFVMATLLAVSGAGLANAQEDEGVVSYRQKLMDALRIEHGKYR